MSLEITYGNHKIDLESIPQTSVIALASAGLAHTLGNVVASKIVAEIRKAINSEKPSGVTTEAVKAWRSANEDKISALSAKFQGEALAAIAEGKLGVHSPRRPSASADPLQAEMRKLAKTQITDILIAAGMKFPGVVKGKASTVTLKGKEWTGEELVSNRLDVAYPNNNREAIEAEAKRNLAARKRAVEANAKVGVEAL